MIHFIHGLIGGPNHFRQVIRRLPLGSRVHAPKLDYLAHDLPALARQVTCGPGAPSVVVGNSLGCQIAMHMAPQADSYILTAPPFDFSKGQVPLRRALIRPWVEGLYQNKGDIEGEAEICDEACAMLQTLIGSRRAIAQVRRMKSQAQAFLDSAALRRLQDRVHFVIGAQDYTTPPDAVRAYMKREIPQARLTVIPGCGHAIPVERPDVIAGLIGKACKCKPPAAGATGGCYSQT